MSAPIFAQAPGAAPNSQGGVKAHAPQPEPPKFDILEFQIEGNTTLPQETIERSVYPFMGEHKNINDVEAARAALEGVYRDKGYGTVAVTIPEQSVAQGQVRLQVHEGRIEQLDVVNAKYYSQGRILAQVESLQEGKVPYFPKVQEELAQVNTSADRKVTPVLRPGKEPGTTDVDLEVTDSLPLHGSLTLDNDNTPMTSALRLTGAIEYDNLFQRDQHISLLYQMSPEDLSQVKLFSLSYTIPIAGQIIALSFVRSDSASVAGVGGIDVFGKGKIIGVHDVIPITATKPTPGETFSQIFNIGLDYKSFDQNVVVGQNSAAGFATPIRYAPFSFNYSAILNQDHGEWDWGGGLEFAARNFGSDATEFDDKRYKALSNFVILKLDAQRIQPLPESFSLFGRLDIQLADQPLVSNEQMVVGGLDSVRGYLSASETGDSGARTSFELRTPNVAPLWAVPVDELSFHLFADAAYVRIFSPLPEQIPSFTLESTGVGLRLKQAALSNFSLDVAWPIRTIQYTRAWAPRLQASATLSF